MLKLDAHLTLADEFERSDTFNFPKLALNHQLQLKIAVILNPNDEKKF